MSSQADRTPEGRSSNELGIAVVPRASDRSTAPCRLSGRAPGPYPHGSSPRPFTMRGRPPLRPPSGRSGELHACGPIVHPVPTHRHLGWVEVQFGEWDQDQGPLHSPSGPVATRR